MALPKAIFKTKIQPGVILLKMLENEDSYIGLEFIISKFKFYTS